MHKFCCFGILTETCRPRKAQVAELVDALGSGPSARLGCGSSSLLLGTNIKFFKNIADSSNHFQKYFSPLFLG